MIWKHLAGGDAVVRWHAEQSVEEYRPLATWAGLGSYWLFEYVNVFGGITPPDHCRTGTAISHTEASD